MAGSTASSSSSPATLVLLLLLGSASTGRGSKGLPHPCMATHGGAVAGWGWALDTSAWLFVSSANGLLSDACRVRGGAGCEGGGVRGGAGCEVCVL